jgi:hypothetical protein
MMVNDFMNKLGKGYREKIIRDNMKVIIIVGIDYVFYVNTLLEEFAVNKIDQYYSNK